MTAAVVEKVATFGGEGRLVGMLSLPPPSMRRSAAVVILNAGVIHRVGPNRLSVRLARRLAADGFVTLRFDLSGIGDSAPGEAVHDSVRVDIDAALAFLARAAQTTGFVLVGLCTGANTSLRYAWTHPDIVGAALLDPYAYRTPGFYLRHYGKRLLRWETWRNAVTGRRRILGTLRVALQGRNPLEPEHPPPPSDLAAPPQGLPKAEMETALTELTGRGVQLLNVFTGGNIRYNYTDQFWEQFPRLAGNRAIRVEFLPDAEHTFDRIPDQRAVIALIREWLRSTRFARRGGAPLENQV